MMAIRMNTVDLAILRMMVLFLMTLIRIVIIRAKTPVMEALLDSRIGRISFNFMLNDSINFTEQSYT